MQKRHIVNIYTHEGMYFVWLMLFPELWWHFLILVGRAWQCCQYRQTTQFMFWILFTVGLQRWANPVIYNLCMYINTKLLNANRKVGMNKGGQLINRWRACAVHVDTCVHKIGNQHQEMYKPHSLTSIKYKQNNIMM